MSVLNNSLLLGAPAGGGGGGYQIERSLRFNSADSAYLNRTPASAGNRKTWTWSGWVKRSKLATSNLHLLLATPDGFNSLYTRLLFASNNIYVSHQGGSSFAWQSNSLHRDASAWFHLVVAFDTPQATASNRLKIYVNGVQITASSATYPSINQDLYVNSANPHEICGGFGAEYFDGYLADVYLIDGQALEPTSFGEFDANNVWQPKAYTGSYGTNGFQLKFADNSNNTATTLGKDTSGNSNNWTPNNLSVTAGADNDSLVDTPTNYGTDTGAGGQVRGNYCTLSPIDRNRFANTETLSQGNLEVTFGAGDFGSRGTFYVTSGKWYWEATLKTAGTGLISCGISQQSSQYYTGYSTGSYAYLKTGNKMESATTNTYGASYAANDVIGIGLNLDAGTLTFYKNGTSQGQAFSSVSGVFTPSIGCSSSDGTAWILNFGQRAFAYTAPSGFKALCTANLPTPIIANGATAMDVVTYTGTGSSLTPTSTLGFNPDLVWIKSRSAATDHAIYDSVRGTQIRLESNNGDVEVATDNGVTAFNSAGFTLGTLAQVNTNAATYAAWCWDAGTSTVTNTAGSISAQVRANANTGCSVITATTTNTTSQTFGHGLGVAPAFHIIKLRNYSDSWYVYHASLGATKHLRLNASSAQATSGTMYNNTEPTSALITLGSDWAQTIYNIVCYAFAPVAGFSAFGSYNGNSSTDGPFVYTNFRPKYVLVKAQNVGADWQIYDAARNLYNLTDNDLCPATSDAENAPGVSNGLDFVSNGFKLRSLDSWLNGSAYTYVYAAFAESPFQSARAR